MTGGNENTQSSRTPHSHQLTSENLWFDIRALIQFYSKAQNKLILISVQYINLYLKLGGHFGHGLEEVFDQSEVSDCEDRSLFVFVDGHNGLAVLHAGQVLNGTGDTHLHDAITRM